MLLPVVAEGAAKLEPEYAFTVGLVISLKKFSSTLQVAPSHAGVPTVVKVATGQPAVLVRVVVGAVSLQITVEKQDALQLCTALVLAAQLAGTHKAPQALVVIVLAQDAEDFRVDEKPVDLFDREVVRMDETIVDVIDREDVRMDETTVDVIDGLE